jgi:hypothetical protein
MARNSVIEVNSRNIVPSQLVKLIVAMSGGPMADSS